METEVVKRGSIAEIVRAYEQAMVKIDSAYSMLQEAQEELKAAFNIGTKYDTDFGVLPGRHRNYNDNVDEKSVSQAKDVIKRKAWRQLYVTLEIDRIASIKRRDEISRHLEDGELPEITVKNVFELFEALNQNINDFAKESAKEVYDWLRPATDGWEIKRFKTNQKNAVFELGKKIIKSMMVQNKYGGGFHTNYYNEKYLIALDKVFHMLDAKSMLEGSYRSPLVDLINTSEGSTVQTDYFFCHMYQNGNLHIEFLRLDLLKSLNAMMGGNNLKPAN